MPGEVLPTQVAQLALTYYLTDYQHQAAARQAEATGVEVPPKPLVVDCAVERRAAFYVAHLAPDWATTRRVRRELGDHR